MKINNKKIFLLATLVILIVGISAISAADSSADTNDISTSTSDVATTTSVDSSSSTVDSSSSASDSSSSTQTTSSSSSSESTSSTTHTTDSSSSSSSDVSTSSSANHATDSTSSSDVKTTSSSSSVTNTDSSNTNANVDTSNAKNLKTETNSNINTTAINETPSNSTQPLDEGVNDNTFDTYFNDDGTINVLEGTTLTFTGDVTRDQSYIIDVPVNIIGNGYTLSLNSNSISFVAGAANSNVTGLKFNNTQVFVNTTENIVFDNIDVSVTANGLGGNVGAFAIRDGSGNITVQNSNFYSEDNGGRSLLALTLVENCTINNNTITGVGNVGNLVYINVYNGDPANTKGVTTNKNNTISNNYITGPSTNVAVCYAVGLSGYGNKVINNTIDYIGYAITTSWVGDVIDDSEDPGDEHTLESYQNQYINNTVLNNGRVTGAANTTFIGNNFTGSVTVSDDSIVTNNTLTNVTVNGAYNEITYNTVNKINLTSTSSYNTVKNNYVADDIYDNGKNNIIEDNIYTLSSTSKALKTDDDEQLVIYVTEENKDTYFRNDGSNYYTLVTRNFAQANTTYYLDFDLDNSQLFISPASNTIAGVVFSGVEGRTYTNLTIDVNAARNNTIANFNIVDGQIILRSPGSENTLCVENNTLTVTLDSNLERLDNAAVYIGFNNQGENNTNPIIFRNNVINYTVRAYSIDWGTTSIPYDIVMYVDTHDTSLVYNNTISITEFDSDDTTSPTLYGIYYSSGGSGNISCFDNNTLILEGQEYMYGLVLGNSVNGLNITGNNITVTSINYTNGIKLQNNCKNVLIANNTVNCTSGLDYAEIGNQYVVYAIYVENWNYMGGTYKYLGNNINDTIANNTIIGTGNQVYGIEGFGYDDSNITGNTIIVTGTQPQGMGIIGANLNITENTITVEGVSPDQGITVDYVAATTTGIQLPYASESETNISKNTITVTSGRGILIDAGTDYVNIDDNTIIVSNYTYSVELNSTGTNSNVTNNYLKTDKLTGDESVYESTEGNTIRDNQPNGIETFISIDPIVDAKVADVITIKGTVTNLEEEPFIDSKVMITINDEEPITVDVAEDGTFETEYTVIKVGENTVTAEFIADDTFSYSQDSITFEVPEIVTNIIINNITAYPSTEYTIEGTLINYASLQLEDQKVTVIFNDERIDVDVAEDGSFSIDLVAPSIPGDYNIIVFYAGNEEYEFTYATATLTVEEYDSFITVNDATNRYNNETTIITGTLTDENDIGISDAIITITIEEETYTGTTNSEGTYTIEITTPSIPGTYTVTANYNGDETYKPASNTAQLEVINADTSITINDIPATYTDKTTTVTGTLTDAYDNTISDATITITIEEETYTGTTNSEGTYTIEITTPSIPGTYTVTASYNGDESYEPSSQTTQLEVITTPTTMTINNISPALSNKTVTVTGTLTDVNNDAISDATVTITIEDETYTGTTDTEGTYTIEILTPNSSGTYDVTASYNGDVVYEPSEASTILTVEKTDTLITANSVTGKYGDTVKLTAIVTDTEFNNVNEGRVVFKLNGVTIKDEEGNSIYADVVDGIASMDYVITNNIGTYTITATYSGSNIYTEARTESDAQLTVTNATADITITDLPSILRSGETITLTAVVSDDGRLLDGGIVIFKLNGVTLKNADGGNLNATVVNGIATVEYTIPVDYSAKDYVLTAVYSAKNYDRIEDNTTITLTRSNVTAVLEPVYITQGENATIRLVLYDQNGNQLERSTKVAVKVNGKTFANTETENGVLETTIDTADFKNPNYNLTVVLGENSAYNELRLNSILVVDPSIDSATDLTTYSATVTTDPITEPLDIVGANVSSNDNGTIIKE